MTSFLSLFLPAAGLSASVGFGRKARSMGCLPRPSRRMPFPPAASLLAGGILALGTAAPAQALTWNWTANTSACPSSGTLQTDGSAYVANQSYKITTITGDICGNQLTGELWGDALSNNISWDGTASSQVLTKRNGIEFKVLSGGQIVDWRWYMGGGDTFLPISPTNYNGTITFSLLTPATAAHREWQRASA